MQCNEKLAMKILQANKRLVEETPNKLTGQKVVFLEFSKGHYKTPCNTSLSQSNSHLSRAEDKKSSKYFSREFYVIKLVFKNVFTLAL